MSGVLHALVEDAAREAGCTVAQMVGPIRERHIVAARHEAMARAYASGFSTVQIGAAFARDHSTVIHAIRRNRPVNGLPYYKRYPRDFLEGTIGMDFELKGAYGLVLDLIYMQGGQLPDDPRYISGLLGCSMRKWNSLRDGLISAGKLEAKLGYLTNYRAVIELETFAKLQDKQRENRARPNKINGLQSPKPNHTDTDTDTEREDKKKESAREALAVVVGDELAGAFVAHRKALRSPMTPHGGKLLAKKLATMSDPTAAVERAIERGWRSAFEDTTPPKDHRNGHAQPSRSTVALDAFIAGARRLPGAAH